MSSQIYYNSTGTTPLKEVENNVVFYNQLIVEYGYATAENLFPAEQLHQMIVQLSKYRNVAPITLISKIDANILHYKKMYKKITRLQQDKEKIKLN